MGCHGQVPGASAKLPAETARRVEILIRTRSRIPPGYTIDIGPRTKSDFPEFDTISVTFTANGHASPPTIFLLSKDSKTLAQFTKFDIGKDPKELVSAADRPARGGPANAPVTIVVFDDLECPFCAKMHQAMFPAVLDHYKDQVHIVYRDFPLPGHPWAMRAAIDSNCVGAHSTTGYWNYVDYVHSHGQDISGAQADPKKSFTDLDNIASTIATQNKVDKTTLTACLQKQDDCEPTL